MIESKYKAYPLVLFLLALVTHVFASATFMGNELFIVVVFCFALFFIINYQRISFHIEEKFGFMAILFMFVWTKRLEGDVLLNNIYILIIIFCFAIARCTVLKDHWNYIFNILVAVATVYLVFILAELLLRDLMSPILRIFLSPEMYVSEMESIKRGTSLRGLATSTNAISYASMILLMSGLFITERKIKKVLQIGIALIGFVVCAERSNMIFAPLIIVMLTVFKYKYGDSKNKNRILLWCFIILVTAIIIAPYLLALPAFEKTLVSIQALKAGESVDLSRAILYKRAIEMWLEKPILGHGWFEYYYSNTGIILTGSRSFAHNLFLECLAECGIVGTAIVFLPIIYSIVNNIKALSYRNCNQSKKNIFIFTLGYQIFFLADCLLHLTFYSSRLYLYFCVVYLYYAAKDDYFRTEVDCTLNTH